MAHQYLSTRRVVPRRRSDRRRESGSPVAFCPECGTAPLTAIGSACARVCATVAPVGPDRHGVGRGSGQFNARDGRHHAVDEGPVTHVASARKGRILSLPSVGCVVAQLVHAYNVSAGLSTTSRESGAEVLGIVFFCRPTLFVHIGLCSRHCGCQLPVVEHFGRDVTEFHRMRVHVLRQPAPARMPNLEFDLLQRHRLEQSK